MVSLLCPEESELYRRVACLLGIQIAVMLPFATALTSLVPSLTSLELELNDRLCECRVIEPMSWRLDLYCTSGKG